MSADPYLVLRNARYDKAGRLTHRATWIINDGTGRISTGCSEDDEAGAKQALRDYWVDKYGEKPLVDGLAPDQVFIGDLIRFYLSDEEMKEKIEAKSKSRRRDFDRDIDVLIEFWGAKTVADINYENLTQFKGDLDGTVDETGKLIQRNKHTVRKQLEYLRSIVNFGEDMGKLNKFHAAINYQMPEKAESRLHYFDRSEVAKLVWHAYMKKGGFGAKSSVHIARFILVAAYTGTRSERIFSASFIQEAGRPWIDLEKGIYYRVAKGKFAPHNKRASPISLPDSLLAHMRRWANWDAEAKLCRPGGSRYLVEYHGRPADPRRGFYSLKTEVFSEERAKEVNRHTLKHTCATWLIEAGVELEEVAYYLSTTEKIVRDVYGHLSPEANHGVKDAFRKGKAGRGKQGRQPKKKKPDLHLVKSDAA